MLMLVRSQAQHQRPLVKLKIRSRRMMTRWMMMRIMKMMKTLIMAHFAKAAKIRTR